MKLTYLPFLVASVAAIGELGFNIGTKNNDGTCKDANAYTSDLNRIKGYASSVKIFSTSDCNTLQILGPVADNAGVGIHVGVWPTPDDKWETEKQALTEYLPKISKSSVKAFLVGSEALYRGDLTGDELASKITELKTFLEGIKDKNGNSYGGSPVTFVDSWNKYQDGTANPAIAVSDAFYVNAFSFWQGIAQDNSSYSFYDDIMQALQIIQTAKGSTDLPFYVGETGWPTKGANFGSAVPGVSAAADYYQKAICSIRALGVNVIQFEYEDEVWKPVTSDTDEVENNWGAWDSNNNLKYPLNCKFT
ncbi:BGL2 Glucan 1 [Candida maltosa Xu316]|uniref:glucan 1,3-beta-glucosidase n=1 Tax=Candida maltosa (strain Xu316) TaxID=1245528 RepID=M3HLS3_CANMX|nr:Glucan 1,3-beta-glucosidase [Candida maltosa Xu316]